MSTPVFRRELSPNAPAATSHEGLPAYPPDVEATPLGSIADAAAVVEALESILAVRDDETHYHLLGADAFTGFGSEYDTLTVRFDSGNEVGGPVDFTVAELRAGTGPIEIDPGLDDFSLPATMIPGYIVTYPDPATFGHTSATLLLSSAPTTNPGITGNYGVQPESGSAVDMTWQLINDAGQTEGVSTSAGTPTILTGNVVVPDV